MENYKIQLSRQAEKAFEKIQHSDTALSQRILAVFDLLQHEPYLGKALSGELKGRFSYRIGVYRIIYAVVKHQLVIYVLDIGHRRGVYR